MTLEEIKNKIDTEKENADTIGLLTEYIEKNPDSEEALILRGMQYWATGHRGKAITDYLTAIRLNPDSRANTLLASANQILDFYNKDLYNP